MSKANAPRVPKGVTAGGQFKSSSHLEPSVRLAEYAKPLEYPAGARAMVSGQMGRIFSEPDGRGNLYINMDGGGCVVTKPVDVVNWDAYLEVDMPVIEPGLHHDGNDVRPDCADNLLQHQLTLTRNALTPPGDAYFDGQARASAEVAAALLNPDADSALTVSEGKALRAGNLDDLYGPDSVKGHKVPAAMTEKRSRQLASYFHILAIAVHGALPRANGDVRHELKGLRNAYVEAAVRLDNKNAPGLPYTSMTGRVLTSLTLGDDDPNTIMAEVRD